MARGPQGTRFTDGFEFLLAAGEREATIMSVRSIGGDEPGLGSLFPAEGAFVRPREDTPRGMGYELLSGYELEDDSKVAYRSLTGVTYRIGDTAYVWRSPGRLVYCPPGMKDNYCDDLAESADYGA